MSNWVWFQDALLNGITSYTAVADAGVFTLTGYDVGATLIATPASYAMTGNAAGLDKGFAVAGEAGDFALTGNDIGEFQKGFRLFATKGEYHMTGNRHTFLIRTRVPITDPEPYVETAWVQPENEGSTLDAEVEWEA